MSFAYFVILQEGLFGLEANVKKVQEYGFPRYLPYQEKIDREKDIYFIPSRVLGEFEYTFMFCAVSRNKPK